MNDQQQDHQVEQDRDEQAVDKSARTCTPITQLQQSVGNRRLLQLRRTLRGAIQARGVLDGSDVHAAAEHGLSGAASQLPHLEAIQRAFGHHDVGEVRSHVGGASAEAADAMGAVAYASGDDVAFANSPDLHLAAHEAAHIVQQRGGVRLSDGVGSAGDDYERHADAVADLVVRGESAESLLDEYAHRGAAGGKAVQRREPGEGGGAPAQQCSEGPADNVDVTLATTAMRGAAEHRAQMVGSQVPIDALDQVIAQLEELVASRRVGSTRTGSANIGGNMGVSHQWTIRADVQRRRVGVCGQQRMNDATLSESRTSSQGGEIRAEDGNQRTQQQTMQGQAGLAIDGGPSASGSAQEQRGSQQTRDRGTTQSNERGQTEGVSGQGDMMIEEEEWEYSVTWIVETRVADRRPPESGLFGGGNDWSLNNTIASMFETTPFTQRDTTVIGTRRENSIDLTPGARPQPSRRR